MTRRAIIALRIGAVVLIVLAVAVVAVHVNRDRIALEVANSALAGTGVKVRDASIASLGTDEVRFSDILLELDGGTLVRIEDVTLPVRFRGFAGSVLRAGRVTVTDDDSGGGPLPLATALRSWLEAPSVLPEATVMVTELVVPGLPAIRDFVWSADPQRAELHATIEPYTLGVTAAPGNEADFGTALRLQADGTEALDARAAIRFTESGAAELDGTFTMELAPLIPALNAAGAIPAGIVDPEGRVTASFTTLVPAEPGGLVDARLQVRLGDDLRFGYRPDDASPATNIAVPASSPVDVTFEYPVMRWSAAVDRAELHIVDERFGELPVTIGSASCSSGIACRADDFSVTIDQPAWAGRKLPSMTLHGALTASSDSVSATLQPLLSGGGLGARLGVGYSLGDGSGTLRVEDGEVRFDRLPPSRLLGDWPYAWDLHRGTVRVDGTLRWSAGPGEVSYTGSFGVAADDVAGIYGDVAFLGVATAFDVAVKHDTGPTVTPLTVGVELIDVGFPIENLRLSAEPDLDDLAAEVTALTMSTLGGTVGAEPFRYDLDADANRIVLELDGIQLPLIVGLADLEAVEVSGSVSGTLPVTIAGGAISIEGGRLRNEPPGGVIRYRAGTPVGGEQSQLGIVTRTLRNFEFDTLSSEVSYSDAGDLKLQMRLTGVNPDVDATQPVILNLGVEDNIPQLLRSLQAARSIEDILERRYSR